MTWWGWMILGAVLLSAELFAIDAQFYLVFLGIAAMLVSLAGLVGVAMPVWVQWLVFAFLSLIFMFTFRKVLHEKIRGGAKGFRTTIVGATLDVADDLAPGKDARAEFRGTDWTIRNVGDDLISGGARAKVVAVEGLTLHVVAD